MPRSLINRCKILFFGNNSRFSQFVKQRQATSIPKLSIPKPSTPKSQIASGITLVTVIYIIHLVFHHTSSSSVYYPSFVPQNKDDLGLSLVNLRELAQTGTLSWKAIYENRHRCEETHHLYHLALEKLEKSQSENIQDQHIQERHIQNAEMKDYVAKEFQALTKQLCMEGMFRNGSFIHWFQQFSEDHGYLVPVLFVSSIYTERKFLKYMVGMWAVIVLVFAMDSGIKRMRVRTMYKSEDNKCTKDCVAIQKKRCEQPSILEISKFLFDQLPLKVSKGKEVNTEIGASQELRDRR